ncbi:RNA polymerase sigma-70 factor [Puteibacter caeruleilacunae]|nr:RNA polymerase sigma-70 factor [Puteibacter caeruleilacunae]
MKVFDIELIQKGNRKEFEKVYLEFFDVLYHLCLQYLQNEKVAEELVQDAFMKLWIKRADLKAETNLRNLLYTMTKHRCLNYLRDEQTALQHAGNLRHIEMQFNYEALNRLGNEMIEFKELQDIIQQAIDKLPPEQREVFMMSRDEELKYREIAERLDISVKTVEARMSKALNYLRVELKDYLHIAVVLSVLQ